MPKPSPTASSNGAVPDGASRHYLDIAASLSRRFHETAAARDKAGGTPKHERDLLRASGLLALSIPVAYGGVGASWPETLRAVRILARADSSIAHVFGFQHLLLATVRLFGNEEQWTEAYSKTAANSWFWGNALNPLDTRASLAAGDGNLVLSGTKSFCSGASDSDRLVVSAIDQQSQKLVIATLETSRTGIRVHDDWDNMGQRQTDSGTVDFDSVQLSERELLRTPGPLGSVFASLRPLLAQILFCNVFLGIAEGALEEAKAYTRGQTRPWIASGVERATDDPYILRHYGELWLAIESGRVLVEKAAGDLQAAWDQGNRLTPEERGNCSVAIATAKVATTRGVIDVTNRIFEVTGARATAAKAGLDRYWRNARTQTLHDPVEYKYRDIGNWVLNEQHPVPSFYS